MRYWGFRKVTWLAKSQCQFLAALGLSSGPKVHNSLSGTNPTIYTSIYLALFVLWDPPVLVLHEAELLLFLLVLTGPTLRSEVGRRNSSMPWSLCSPLMKLFTESNEGTWGARLAPDLSLNPSKTPGLRLPTVSVPESPTSSVRSTGICGTGGSSGALSGLLVASSGAGWSRGGPPWMPTSASTGRNAGGPSWLLASSAWGGWGRGGAPWLLTTSAGAGCSAAPGSSCAWRSYSTASRAITEEVIFVKSISKMYQLCGMFYLIMSII